MKILTSYQLVHIILSNNDEHDCSILPTQISKLVDELEDQPIECYLGGGSFKELSEEYPSSVHYTSTKVEILNASVLKKNLDWALRYMNDEQMDNLVWKKWKAL